MMGCSPRLLLPAMCAVVAGISQAQPVAWSFLWPHELRDAIEVCWESAHREQEKEWIAAAVTQAYDQTPLSFIGWQDCKDIDPGPALVRVSLSDLPPHAKGLGFHVNQRRYGVVINVDFVNYPVSACRDEHRQTYIENFAVHEFGHVTGMPDASVAEGKYCKQRTFTLDPAPYEITDSLSIMHTCGHDLTQPMSLSAQDLDLLHALYPPLP